MEVPRPSLLFLAALFLAGAPVSAEHDEHMVAHAVSAAPEAVSSGATIYLFEDDSSLRTLREGTDSWWCMTDVPVSPSFDPMCGDANALEWATAWITKAEPPAGKPGFIYRLAPGFAGDPADPYAPDPYATGQTENVIWLMTRPHVAVVNAPELMAGYPSEPGPGALVTFVMWAGTPYTHLILPVE